MNKRYRMNPLLFAMSAAGLCTLSTLTAAYGANSAPAIDVSQVHSSGAQSTSVGEVSASANAFSESAKALASTDGKLTKKKVFESTQSQAVLGRREIQGVGPAAGAAQALSLAPGVAVRGYGGIASTARYEIAVRGVKVGWSSVNGDVERNGLTVLFDGIPMNNLISHNGGWDSNEIPILQMIHGINVTYGPGNPAGRWFDSIGGTINFVPLQPSVKPSAEIGTTFGSNGTLGYNFDLKTGMYDGWSAVLAGGYTKNNTFRTGSFSAPSQSFAYFGKAVKTFRSGTFSLGGYVDSSREFRPNFIPVTPIQGVTTQGLNANAPLYSQQTSGFYASLPESIWFKQLKVQDYMLYSKLNLHLSRDVTLHEMAWYRHGYRLHYRITNYTPGNSANSEYYDPTSDTYGDKLYFDWQLPINLLKAGGSWIHQQYTSRYAGYNTLLGTSPSFPSQYNSDVLYNNYLAGFIQDTITPLSGLKITPGVAAVQYQTQMYNNGNQVFTNLPAGAQNQTLINSAADTISGLEPSVGVRFAPVKWGSLYAHYARSYQNPTDNNFGAYNSHGGSIDFNSLKPVKSTDYEVGAKFLVHNWMLLHNFTFNINYYNDHLANETIATYLSNIAQTKFASTNAVVNGVNIAIADNPSWNWHLFANLALNHSYYTSYTPQGGGATLYGANVSYSPDLTMSAGLDYRYYYHGFLFSPQFVDQYTSSQYLFNNVTGAPSHQKQPGYNISNLSLGIKTTRLNQYIPTLKDVKLSVGIYNLFDAQYNPIEYITSGGYFGGNSAGAILADPGAPRQYFVTVAAKF
ncbi:TonB-dependent receptor [Acidithiobacillus sp.]|uniref:TonB-dependent receptor n=1 Tax=Acidithiobacillus sp. TaxID=1872118 RepID=UPI0025B972DC|nr:TonB-dependent receptor [Acidithiobacillus sp.]